MCVLFFFKQKTAYEMRISDWSSDVCSSDLRLVAQHEDQDDAGDEAADVRPPADVVGRRAAEGGDELEADPEDQQQPGRQVERDEADRHQHAGLRVQDEIGAEHAGDGAAGADQRRSEEHTSELQSLMRTSYAVSCLNKNTTVD